MAILNKIRQKTVVLILVIALALFAFILSGLFDNSNAIFSKSQNVVATINGKDISREAFMATVESQQNPNTTSNQVMNRVFEAQVRKLVMETQFDALGLTVGREQMRDLLKQNLANSPEFQNESGLFDEAKLNEYIINLKETSPAAYKQWVDYETNVSSGALQQNYFNLVKAGTTATLAEGEIAYKLDSDKVDLKYVQVPYSSIADSTIAVSKSEISSYISKNKKRFEVEASRNLQYVEFKEEASVEDETLIQEALNKLVKGSVEYNDGKTDTIVGFSAISSDKVEAFVNTHSDEKYNDAFVFENALPAVAKENLLKLNVGEIYGPYKDGNKFKVTKLVAVKQLPDSVKARHILIPFLGASSAKPEVTQTEAQAKVTADSLLAVIKANRSKFPELVTEFSSDLGSVEKGGKYDWFPYNRMVPEFRDFSFENKVGDIGVVKTAFGFHIIEIEGQKDKKKAYKFATLARTIEPSTATEDKVFRDASNFEVLIGKKDFQAAAIENKLTVKPVSSVKILDENIPGIGNQRPIVRWSFDEGTKVGDTKRFNVAGGYVIVQVTGKNEAGLMNVEDASVTVLPELRKEKKAKLIRDRVSVTNLDDFAAAENQTVKTATAVTMKTPTIAGAGKEPLVVGTAFGLDEGATSKLITGEKGVYMIQVTKKTPGVELENYQPFANQVSTEKLQSVNTRLYNALKSAAEIEDNRAQTVQ